MQGSAYRSITNSSLNCEQESITSIGVDHHFQLAFEYKRNDTAIPWTTTTQVHPSTLTCNNQELNATTHNAKSTGLKKVVKWELPSLDSDGMSAICICQPMNRKCRNQLKALCGITKPSNDMYLGFLKSDTFEFDLSFTDMSNLDFSALISMGDVLRQERQILSPSDALTNLKCL